MATDVCLIEARHLGKRFQQFKAVDDVSLAVGAGEIFGLLGPNAAGKTTTIRMLCGVLGHDEGDIRIDGVSIDQAKPAIGYVAQHFGQYEELTVWENLAFYARMYGVSDQDWLHRLLERYGLARFEKRFAGSLSGGYQRRLALACALAHDPRVLFLDEPTAGIDPVTRKLLWDDFYQLSAEGKALFVTTHYMEEAQRCHRLAFLSAGRMVAQGTPTTIREALGDARVYQTRTAYHPQIQQAILQQRGVSLVNQFGDELRMLTQPDLDLPKLQAAINQAAGHDCPLQLGEPNLEDVFIALTQPEGRP